MISRPPGMLIVLERRRSADLGNDRPCPVKVALGVNQRRVTIRVSEYVGCGLDPEARRDECGDRVPKLERTPTVSTAPMLNFEPLLRGQALAWDAAESGVGKCLVAGASDGLPICQAIVL